MIIPLNLEYLIFMELFISKEHNQINFMPDGQFYEDLIYIGTDNQVVLSKKD